jgi:hypothetical protein
MSEIKVDICSPEDHHQTSSSITSPVHFSTHGNNLSINSTVDQLIPRLVDYIRKQNIENDIDLNLIANQVFK